MRLSWVMAIASAAALAGITPCAAQQHVAQGGHHRHHEKAGAGPTPIASYVGQEARSVTSFTDEEVAGHLEGRGLGYAKPAELNGYPGPMHVLELKHELALSREQVEAATSLFEGMRARAREAGRAYIEAERAVDAAFRSGGADAHRIAELVRISDARRAEKRLAHLDAHLEMAKLLSTEQRNRYAELRGYGAARSK